MNRKYLDSYDKVRKEPFWIEFIYRVQLERLFASRRTETSETVSKAQGMIDGYDSLKPLIEDIVEDKPRKDYKPPGILSLENPK